MTEATAAVVPPKAKKSVALSGVTAGNTAFCTVGRTGNDLHYRGYDILDIAGGLRIRGDRAPAGPWQAADRRRASRLQDETEDPARLAGAGEGDAGAHPGSCAPDGRDAHRVSRRSAPSCPKRTTTTSPARGTSPTGCWPRSARCCSTGTTRATTASASKWRPTDDSIGGHFLHLLHGQTPKPLWVRAMHTSLILYAEHEFNASTFTARVIAGTGSDIYSAHHRRHRRAARAEARRRQRGRVRIQKRYDTADEAEADIRRASRTRRSSSASATRSTRSPTRATR